MQPVHGNLHTYSNANDLAEAACQSFVDLAKSTIDASGIFRVSLSGGSTPQRLYALLSKCDLPWDKIEIYWSDERMVPHDHADSNYRMVKQTLLAPAGVPDASVFAVPTSAGDAKSVATEYEQVMRNNFRDADYPDFDLVLLGMGDDAHTASLFPSTEAIHAKERWFVENWVEKLNAYRLTMTAPAINAAANTWFMVTGANKHDALRKVWGDSRDVDAYPSQLIYPVDGLLWWMVTEDAPSN